MHETEVETECVELPRYVLMEGRRRIGPQMSSDRSDQRCTVIYGFTDKGPYDRFQSKSRQKLTPYPLVKQYLVDQLSLDESASEIGNQWKLVVVDAEDPQSPILKAVTLAALLVAIESNAQAIQVSLHLVLDSDLSVYRVESAD